MELNKRRQNFFSKTVQYPLPIQSTFNVRSTLSPNSYLDSPTEPDYLVDMDLLHRFCSKGIPDLPGYRPTCWKLLLGYLPSDKREWSSTLNQQRKAYYDFVKDLVVDSGYDFPLSIEARNKLRSSKHASDKQREEVALVEQIDLDVRRTLADHSFFQQPVKASSLSISSSCTSPCSNSPPLSPSLGNFHSPLPPNLTNVLSENTTPWDSYQANNRPLFRPQQPSTQNFDLDSRPEQTTNNLTHLNLETGATSSFNPKSYSHRSSISDGFLLSPAMNLDAEIWSPKLISSPIRNPWIDASETSDLLDNLNLNSSPRIAVEPNLSQSSEPALDFHWEALERILYIYAKLNPGVGYVQGMNEILGPIYYVCAHDKEDCLLEGPLHAEADAFYLFTAVMGSVRDQFVKQLDHDSRVGVKATLNILETKLFQVAPDLANDLNKKGLNSAYYAFRWITLLGAQEFDLPDVIRLWDALLSHTPLYLGSENGIPNLSNGLATSPLNTMIMVCVAMLCLTRPVLMSGSFTDNLQLLQSYPPLYDIATIVELAYHIEALPPGTSLDFHHFVAKPREVISVEPSSGSPEKDSLFSWSVLSTARISPVSSNFDKNSKPSPRRQWSSYSDSSQSSRKSHSKSASETLSWFRTQASKWL